MLVLFLIVFAQINYLQVFAADRLADNPANATGNSSPSTRSIAGASWRATGRRCSRRAEEPRRPEVPAACTRTVRCTPT